MAKGDTKTAMLRAIMKRYGRLCSVLIRMVKQQEHNKKQAAVDLSQTVFITTH